MLFASRVIDQLDRNRAQRASVDAVLHAVLVVEHAITVRCAVRPDLPTLELEDLAVLHVIDADDEQPIPGLVLENVAGIADVVLAGWEV